MTKAQFANRIKNLRAATGLSQAATCKALGISKRLYEIYESENHASLPTCKNLIALGNHFNCSIDYLLYQTENPKGYQKKS